MVEQHEGLSCQREAGGDNFLKGFGNSLEEANDFKGRWGAIEGFARLVKNYPACLFHRGRVVLQFQ